MALHHRSSGWLRSGASVLLVGVSAPGLHGCAGDQSADIGAAVALVAMVTTAVVSVATPPQHPVSSDEDADVTRYRLRLRENPVDPEGAFHCRGECQGAQTLDSYLTCLSECPGFEVTPGVACDTDDVLPAAVCITARRRIEPDPNETARRAVEITMAATAIMLCLASSDGCIPQQDYQPNMTLRGY